MILEIVTAAQPCLHNRHDFSTEQEGKVSTIVVSRALTTEASMLAPSCIEFNSDV